MISMEKLIQVGGLLHLGVLSAAALVPAALGWRRELSGLSTLTRQLIWVHGAYVSLMIVAFAALSLGLSGELCSGSALARAVVGFIGVFWTIRLVLGFFLFDLRPHLTSAWRRAGELGLMACFSYFAVVYTFAALASRL